MRLMKKIIFKSISRTKKLSLIFLISIISVPQAACQYFENNNIRDLQLEEKVVSTLQEAKRNQQGGKINLNSLFEKPWVKACFQSPYLEEEQFEQISAQNVTGYSYVADDFYVLWVFYEDGSSKWAKIHRAKVMDKAQGVGPSCVLPSSPWLYIARQNDVEKYHF